MGPGFDSRWAHPADAPARAGASVYPGANGAGIQPPILECGRVVVLAVLLVSSKAALCQIENGIL